MTDKVDTCEGRYNICKVASFLPLFLLILLISCQSQPETVPVTGFDSEVEIAIPTPVPEKTNVAFVYEGPIGERGWTFAHNQGREFAEANGQNINTAYVEGIPEGEDASRVIRSLADQGFEIIFTTSVAYMQAASEVAADYPAVVFVQVAGHKNNGVNLSNINGGMEEVSYIAGMVAGAKAQEDGSNRLGIIAPFPNAETVRRSNAAALGMQRVCPDCTMDIRWVFSRLNPVKEREAALELLVAGATVIINGTDSNSRLEIVGERGFLGVANGSNNACQDIEAICLGVTYWDWGPLYLDIITQVQTGNWQPSNFYGGVNSGLVGYLGFGDGDTMFTGVPASVIPEVDSVLAQMKAGDFTRFDIFTGPINDNQGKEIVPAGVSLTQSDLEGLTDGYLNAHGIEGREPCRICMNFLVEGVDVDAEIPEDGG